MNLVSKKILQVTKCEHVEFFELCYGVVKARILHGINKNYGFAPRLALRLWQNSRLV
jgi:hypothetical protein